MAISLYRSLLTIIFSWSIFGGLVAVAGDHPRIQPEVLKLLRQPIKCELLLATGDTSSYAESLKKELLSSEVKNQLKLKPDYGVGIILRDDHGRVLGARRKGSHSAGDWSYPGGHIEDEPIFETVKREAREELGVEVEDLHFVGLTTEEFQSKGKVYFTFHVIARIKSGTPKVMEAEKVDGNWEWQSWSNLPEGLAPWVKNLKRLLPDLSENALGIKQVKSTLDFSQAENKLATEVNQLTASVKDNLFKELRDSEQFSVNGIHKGFPTFRPSALMSVERQRGLTNFVQEFISSLSTTNYTALDSLIAELTSDLVLKTDHYTNTSYYIGKKWGADIHLSQIILDESLLRLSSDELRSQMRRGFGEFRVEDLDYGNAIRRLFIRAPMGVFIRSELDGSIIPLQKYEKLHPEYSANVTELRLFGYRTLLEEFFHYADFIEYAKTGKSISHKLNLVLESLGLSYQSYPSNRFGEAKNLAELAFAFEMKQYPAAFGSAETWVDFLKRYWIRYLVLEPEFTGI